MNLRQVRKKTKSITNVKKITKAMQLVSAVKMKKAQQLEIEGRPYRDTLTNVIKKIMPSVENFPSALLPTIADKKDNKLVILISSNKGLCGAFHVNLQRFLLQNNSDIAKTDFVSLGTKGSQFILRIGGKIMADFSKNRFLNEVSAVFGFVLDKYLKGEYETVSIVYNKYRSSFKSEPEEEILLPFKLDIEDELAKAEISQYLIEPAASELIEPLLKSYLEEKIRGAIISSEAVEHASRMMAMKNATDNATDIIYNLTLVGNKLRQEKITNELLDMVTAKESVETI